MKAETDTSVLMEKEALAKTTPQIQQKGIKSNGEDEPQHLNHQEIGILADTFPS